MWPSSVAKKDCPILKNTAQRLHVGMKLSFPIFQLEHSLFYSKTPKAAATTTTKK